MKYTLIAAILMAIFVPAANASCKTNQVNGIWQGTFNYPTIGFVGICTVAIKGTRLLSDSVCTDDFGDARPLSRSRVDLHKPTCTLEVSFRTLGQDVTGVFTVDRQETVMTGIVANEALEVVGTATLVKKDNL
ncbi:hypothetical protein F0M18_06220 [Pseudohalioglobus sediminis]|uniref:Uncharacterized protein n=1 Tax=Pseudohalioglobus sediminis TaxID=2606449 RepID=A0A5B0X4D4_9GAMM|nr:hypothetical protein [Pseudohalioglobus sediminis]KAA1193427.1 hypothetical protein F0M18_06220 [Pseudohalioglobus sediminis]